MAGTLVFRALALAASATIPLTPSGAAMSTRAPHTVFAPVLIYHHVKWPKPVDNAIERGLTVLPGAFADQLHFLQSNGYHAISAAMLVSGIRRGASLPSRPVVLTFDDGYTDMYLNVYRVLRSRNLTATFFIVPGFLGTPRYLTWAQVMDMSRHGMDIEAHTMTHPDLRLIPVSHLSGEVAGSRWTLERRLHRKVDLFAYPYGGYNAAILRAVTAAGFTAAFTTRQGWNQSSSALLTLPRVYVDQDDTIPIFAGRLRADPLALAQDPY